MLTAPSHSPLTPLVLPSFSPRSSPHPPRSKDGGRTHLAPYTLPTPLNRIPLWTLLKFLISVCRMSLARTMTNIAVLKARHWLSLPRGQRHHPQQGNETSAFLCPDTLSTPQPDRLVVFRLGCALFLLGDFVRDALFLICLPGHCILHLQVFADFRGQG